MLLTKRISGMQLLSRKYFTQPLHIESNRTNQIVCFAHTLNISGNTSLDLGKGASIYDVRTEGGRGVSPKEDVVREVA